VASEFLRTRRRTVGLRDIPLVFFAPTRLFAKVEDVNAYLVPLFLLLALVTLVGYATIETGLIDRRVQEQVNTMKAHLEKSQFEVMERAQFRKALEDLDKQGQFLRLITRLQVVVMSPVGMLTGILLTAAVFYGLVALSGRKPEWNTLMTVQTYACYIDLLRFAGVLFFMVSFRRLNVDLTLGALVGPMEMNFPYGGMVRAGLKTLLAAADPFALWYWWVVIAGLKTTGQLRGWLMWLSCISMALCGAALRVLGAVAMNMAPAQG